VNQIEFGPMVVASVKKDFMKILNNNAKVI